jgi:hypothetical protein
VLDYTYNLLVILVFLVTDHGVSVGVKPVVSPKDIRNIRQKVLHIRLKFAVMFPCNCCHSIVCILRCGQLHVSIGIEPNKLTIRTIRVRCRGTASRIRYLRKKRRNDQLPSRRISPWKITNTQGHGSSIPCPCIRPFHFFVTGSATRIFGVAGIGAVGKNRLTFCIGRGTGIFGTNLIRDAGVYLVVTVLYTGFAWRWRWIVALATTVMASATEKVAFYAKLAGVRWKGMRCLLPTPQQGVPSVPSSQVSLRRLVWADTIAYSLRVNSTTRPIDRRWNEREHRRE